MPSAGSGAPKRRNRRPWPLFLLLLLVIGGPLAFVMLKDRGVVTEVLTYPVDVRSFMVSLNAKGELQAKNSVDVKSQVEGRSTIIWLIGEGVDVKKDELLARLASDEIEEKIANEEIKETSAFSALAAAEKEYDILLDENESEIRKARLKLELAEIDYKKYEEGDLQVELKEAELAVDKSEEEYNQAQEVFAQTEELHLKEYRSKIELEKDRFAKKEAERGVEKAKLKLKILEKYTRTRELRQKESDVQEAEKELDRTIKSAQAKTDKKEAEVAAKKAELGLIRARLEKYRKQMADTEIKAPADGMVVYFSGENRWDRRQIAEGAEVYERQTIIKLPDTSEMMVKVRIHEANTNKISEGQRARVELEGFPGMAFDGTVTKIAVLADSQSEWLNPDLKEYETEITLDKTEVELKPGITAKAEILVENVENKLAVPIQAVYSRAGKNFVFVGGEDAEPVEVELGSSNEQFVEVASGLKAGQEIRLAASEELRRKLPEEDESQVARADAEGDEGKTKGRSGGRGGGRRGGGRG
jgi:HlyD family secretion protein